LLESSQEVRWCPAPGCNKAIYDPTIQFDNYVGICSCGMKFCWKCGKKVHTPASCEDITTWEEKNASGDLLSLKWVQENTKQCPKCKNPIEKNDGCFMMTCSQCRHQFCWLCRQDWSTHGNHFQCAKYGDSSVQNRPEFREGEADKYILDNLDERFLRYLQRYKQYEGSVKFEDTIKEKFVRLKPHIENVCGILTDFMYEALDQLHLCRDLLMHMFIYLAFNDPSKSNNNEMDTQVGTLEVVTEKLAQILEKDLNEDYIKNENNWVLNIKKVTKVAQKYVQNIFEGNINLVSLNN